MSLAQQIRDALRGKRNGLTCAELLPLCPEAQTNTQIAIAVHNLFKQGDLIREGERGSYRYRALPAGATARTHIIDDDDSPEPSATEAATLAGGDSQEPPSPPSVAPPPKRTATRTSGTAVAVATRPTTIEAPPPVANDLQLAITEAGVLALRRGDACLFLEPSEVQRMTAFLQRVGVAA